MGWGEQSSFCLFFSAIWSILSSPILGQFGWNVVACPPKCRHSAQLLQLNLGPLAVFSPWNTGTGVGGSTTHLWLQSTGAGIRGCSLSKRHRLQEASGCLAAGGGGGSGGGKGKGQGFCPSLSPPHFAPVLPSFLWSSRWSTQSIQQVVFRCLSDYDKQTSRQSTFWSLSPIIRLTGGQCACPQHLSG